MFFSHWNPIHWNDDILLHILFVLLFMSVENCKIFNVEGQFTHMTQTICIFNVVEAGLIIILWGVNWNFSREILRQEKFSNGCQCII